MKFVCGFFDDVIEFEENKVHSLVIENQSVMRELIRDIKTQMLGFDGSAVLSVDNKPCDMKTHCEVLSSFVDFDINKKSLLNKIIGSFEKTALGAEHYYQSQQLLSSIENYIEDISFGFDCELDCTKLSVSNLLKSIGIEIKNEYESDLERMIDYFLLVREFETDKLFILLNMRAFFDDYETELFVKTVKDHKINVLLIDNMEYGLLPEEKRIVIDKDICVFNR